MRSKLSLWLALVALFLIPALAGAQDTTAKIHGHVQDPANAPIANSQVILSTDGKTALYTFTTDANGDYKGEGIKAGSYYVTLFASPGKAVDRFDNVKFSAGTDTPQDFDLSRAEYVNKLPPEQRKALEEAKAKGYKIVLLVGDEPIYTKSGFKKIPKGQVKMPGPVDPARLLVAELSPGAFDGVQGLIRPDWKV